MNIKQSQTINTYIKTFPKTVQGKLKQLREAIQKTSPKATETISYGMPTFKLNGKNLVHFAAYKNHIGFYPTPSAITKFSAELKKYVTSKGAVQFPIDKPIPLSLVKRIVKFRVTETLKITKSK